MRRKSKLLAERQQFGVAGNLHHRPGASAQSGQAMLGRSIPPAADIDVHAVSSFSVGRKPDGAAMRGTSPAAGFPDPAAVPGPAAPHPEKAGAGGGEIDVFQGRRRGAGDNNFLAGHRGRRRAVNDTFAHDTAGGEQCAGGKQRKRFNKTKCFHITVRRRWRGKVSRAQPDTDPWAKEMSATSPRPSPIYQWRRGRKSAVRMVSGMTRLRVWRQGQDAPKVRGLNISQGSWFLNRQHPPKMSGVIECQG